MNLSKKLDRAVQWAGEKMGSDAKTSHSEEFQRLEAEMSLRQEGMEHLQKATSVYSKWLSRRCDAFEDKGRSPPSALLGRTMTAHGNEFEPDSDFGNALVAVGRANERVANLHSNFADDVTANWLHHVDRNVTMMRDYQTARKKLESRRLAYDASVSKMQKSKRDDFRVEEEMRINKTKFDDASEDVMRRMQDVQASEADSIAALDAFLESQLNYHEKAAEELRRVRHALAEGGRPDSPSGAELRISRARSNTSRSWQDARQGESGRSSPLPERAPPRRAASSHVAPPLPTQPPSLPAPSQSSRQSLARAAISGTRTPLASAGARAPSLRATADTGGYGHQSDDVFRDDDDSTGSGDGSHGWGNRSASSATSYDSISRVGSGNELRKATTAAPPPPPPPNRAKKPPPPPVPARRAHLNR
ncbi:uncharacterized protein UV8b_05165 [Ustilaginoidea virens]|uniref:BAR domain-containing protein n=1 Tax=Ustilaginoidea virens TaxID=1159556 RepID=A0A063CAH2_USTVR|nr:uncharacterized protein UV8b_05165 [Ustilaginoidea virens]QUC20924.1 hypothetical protein UV8b_05165 [Ustilaginoidea virens]GAO20081.1 hypothetical protein UVI_02008170 [Ustilaginoidea virens]